MAEERHICALRRQGCGGCPLLETPYPEQLRQKQARVEALLGEFGPVSPILGMEHPWHYRNKAISTFCTGPGRRLDSGIYAAGTHRVVPVASCLLHHPALDEAVEAVRRAARLCRYEPYQEDRGTGLVRHVLVRHSRATGRVLVALVTAAPVLPGARAFVSKVRELCPQVETIVQNINPRRSSAVLGPREKVLWGRGYIEDTLCGVRFRLGASSFYQINPEQTEVLYRTALDGAGLDGTQTVVDAYCGVGTIGLAAAGQARRVLGVEFNPSAARCAAQNARANGAGNARFVCADATAYLQGMAARGERADVVFLDPPRAGSTPEFLGAVDRMGPERIVYISCNPETQRRDLCLLAGRGWKARLLQPVDLFPHTEHVDAIEVSKVADIPLDYAGVMGVPVTFLDKYSPDQFEILGTSDNGNVAEQYKTTPGLTQKFVDDYYRAGGTGSYKAGNPTAGLYVNGVARMIYKRIFVRNKHPEL